MMEKFLTDQQDVNAIEKVYSRLVDLLTTDEEIIYIAAQKKPVVNVLADCIAITNKRILFFTPANFGLSMKVIDFVWKDIVDVQFKEEILGAVFMAKTVKGAEMSVDYLPKIQARKLYQYGQERKEAEREARRQRELEEKRASSGALQFENALKPAYQAPTPVPVQAPPVPMPTPPPPAAVVQVETPRPPAPAVKTPELEPKPDQLTEKLKKLKTLFDMGLISQDDYNKKKDEFLSDL